MKREREREFFKKMVAYIQYIGVCVFVRLVGR